MAGYKQHWKENRRRGIIEMIEDMPDDVFLFVYETVGQEDDEEIIRALEQRYLKIKLKNF